MYVRHVITTAFFAIVGYFVNATYKQRDVLIAFYNLVRDYLGGAQAIVILDSTCCFNFKI